MYRNASFQKFRGGLCMPQCAQNRVCCLPPKKGRSLQSEQVEPSPKRPLPPMIASALPYIPYYHPRPTPINSASSSLQLNSNSNMQRNPPHPFHPTALRRGGAIKKFFSNDFLQIIVRHAMPQRWSSCSTTVEVSQLICMRCTLLGVSGVIKLTMEGRREEQE